MRNRSIKPILIIGTSSDGILLRCNTELPKKNIYPKQEKTSYSVESRENYREFSKNIALKVKAFRSNLNSLQVKNRELELLIRKNTAKTITNSLNKLIINTKEE